MPTEKKVFLPSNRVMKCTLYVHHLSHDILLLIQVVDAQLTQIWHKWSGVVSRAHRIDCHRPKLEIDTLELTLITKVQKLVNQPVS